MSAKLNRILVKIVFEILDFRDFKNESYIQYTEKMVSDKKAKYITDEFFLQEICRLKIVLNPGKCMSLINCS
jgi:hypothetical protein